MKDNLTLIAAAAGGFMLSIALSGILRGTPVTALQGQSSINYYSMNNFQVASVRSEETTDYILEKQK
ncbi:hypothetical protein H6G76_10505 [Nostoc sp. FACHB-152]|uniref:hypothetical protein n=1 Tax=unclassified Nostoc TaxID=2593658 RepID=UPI0016896653|nr:MULTISPECIES: hypothetical protein [unclassified Nostoc]MBD2447594.1 hypothetical protein [Nostoc sp. FACHB-152]MBD2469366.1 hypothetical protein [Nostoc sp. FACHB-145]